MPNNSISFNNLADLLGVSRATVDKWVASGKLVAPENINGTRFLP